MFEPSLSTRNTRSWRSPTARARYPVGRRGQYADRSDRAGGGPDRAQPDVRSNRRLPGRPPRQDGTVRVWNQEDRTLVVTLAAHQNDVTTAAFSPDGALLASGSGDSTVKLWNWRQGRSTGPSMPARGPGGGVLARWRYLAAAMDGEEIRVWDLATGGDALAARADWRQPARSLAFNLMAIASRPAMNRVTSASGAGMKGPRSGWPAIGAG